MNQRRSTLHSDRFVELRQSGSAYIISLLVLVLLTVIGLSLAVTTQTELQIGANEQIATRVFYAADAGIEVAVARGLAAADHSSRVFRLTDDGEAMQTSGYRFFSEIEVTAFVPILDTTCNLCEINNAGSYSENAFRKINHAVLSTAERYSTYDGGVTTTLKAKKEIAGMIEFQPWKVTPDALVPLTDPAQMAKIKF